MVLWITVTFFKRLMISPKIYKSKSVQFHVSKHFLAHKPVVRHVDSHDVDLLEEHGEDHHNGELTLFKTLLSCACRVPTIVSYDKIKALWIFSLEKACFKSFRREFQKWFLLNYIVSQLTLKLGCWNFVYLQLRTNTLFYIYKKFSQTTGKACLRRVNFFQIYLAHPVFFKYHQSVFMKMYW
jgi:hypothetical protein